jgi:FtsZ-binding cell division protein ZapB
MLKFFRQKQQKKSTPKLYRKCSELSIHAYNEIDTYGNYEYLKANQSDEVSDEELQLAWLDIVDEVIHLSNNSTMRYSVERKVKLIALIRKMRVYQSIKYCLDLGVEVTQTLKDYRLKAEIINTNIALLQMEIDKLTPKKEVLQSKKDSKDFEMSIVVLMENGYQVDRFKMSVATWILALNRIEEKHKQNGARI